MKRYAEIEARFAKPVPPPHWTRQGSRLQARQNVWAGLSAPTPSPWHDARTGRTMSRAERRRYARKLPGLLRDLDKDIELAVKREGKDSEAVLSLQEEREAALKRVEYLWVDEGGARQPAQLPPQHADPQTGRRMRRPARRARMWLSLRQGAHQKPIEIKVTPELMQLAALTGEDAVRDWEAGDWLVIGTRTVIPRKVDKTLRALDAHSGL